VCFRVVDNRAALHAGGSARKRGAAGGGPMPAAAGAAVILPLRARVMPALSWRTYHLADLRLAGGCTFAQFPATAVAESASMDRESLQPFAEPCTFAS